MTSIYALFVTERHCHKIFDISTHSSLYDDGNEFYVILWIDWCETSDARHVIVQSLW